MSTNKNTKQIDQDYFSKIDTPNKAYLLGFFIADGCISSQLKKTKELNCFSIALKNSDKEVLYFFQKELSKELTVQTYSTKNGYKISKIQWTSIKMVKDLYQYANVWYKKSYDLTFKINFNNIPDELFRHFFRGFLDGDGMIKKGSCSVELIFNNLQVATGFGEKFQQTYKHACFYIKKDEYYSIRDNTKRNVPLYRFFIKSQRKIKGISHVDRDNYRKLYMTDFYDFLYKDAEFFLKRKKDRFSEYRAKLLNNERLVTSVEHSD